MLTRSQDDAMVGGGRALWGVALGTGLVLMLVASPADTRGWHETARYDGIVVTERVVPGQHVPTFRAIGLIETDLLTVLAVIQDVERHPEWLEDCARAQVLDRESPSVSYVYHRTNVTWPLADRDVIMRTEIDVVEPGRLVFVRFRSAPEKVPPVDGVVRIMTLDGFYRLEALAPRRTSVEYRVDVDPGGTVPSWVRSRATRGIPLETVLGLRQQSVRIAREPDVVLAVESEGFVSPSASTGAVASDGANSRPYGVAPSSAPETAFR